MLDSIRRRAILLGVLFLFCSLGSAFAQTSHLSQPIGNHVMLVTGYISGGSKGCLGGVGGPLVRVYPSGGTSSTEYVVPKGKILVLTDVEWRVILGDPKGGEALTLIISAEGSGYYPFRSSVAVLTAEQANLGAGLAMLGASDQLTAGFQIGEGKRLCMRLSYATGTVERDRIADPQVSLRGYLIDTPESKRRAAAAARREP